MSVYGPNQNGQVLVGKTYAATDDMPDFIASAVHGDIQLFSGDSTAPAAGKPFKILQKHDAAAGGIEYSEVIDPANVEYVKAVAYTAPTARVLRVEGFTGTVRANATYEVWIRLYNDGGTLSPENFRMIPAFYVTPDDVTGITFTIILNALKANLEKTLARETNNLFTITVDTGNGYLIVTGGNTSFVLGKKDGRPVEFALQATVRANGSTTVQSGAYYDDLTVVTVTAGDPGVGTGVQSANLEWFYKGYSYDRYRTMGYPANFETPYQVSASNTYHIVTLSYFKERSYTNVEKQHRVLYILVENADQDGGGAGTAFTAVNALIADLETVTGLTIPDLA